MLDGLFSRSSLTMARPASTIPRCGACGLSETCRTKKMPPDGRGRRRAMIVGEAPGKDEDRQGVPFVGATGMQLEEVVSRFGWDMRRDCILTNALICRPPNNEIKNERVIDYCRPNLLNTIAEHQPEIIILLGGRSVRSLIGNMWTREELGGIKRWAGWAVPNRRHNAWVCPTFHPSYLLREKNPVLDRMFVRHMRSALELSGRPHPNGPPEDHVRVVLSPGEAAERIAKYKRGMIAFDYETTTLKPDGPHAEIYTCSVCWEGEETIAFPWQGEAIRAMKACLKNPDVRKIASNAKFEERWTRHFLGIRVRGWDWDTMLAAHLIDARRGITSIKFQAFVLLGVDDWAFRVAQFLTPADGKKGGNAPNRIKQAALPDVLRYNGLDSLYEFQVATIQRPDLGGSDD